MRLAVDGEFSNELINALARYFMLRRIYLLEFGPATTDDGEPPTVTMEVDALNEQEARVLGQHLVGEAQAAAREARRETIVVWVAPLADGDKSSLRFLGRAKELIEDEDFDLAVVAIQIHLEVQVSTLIRRAARSDPCRKVSLLVGEGDRGWAPQTQSAQRVLEALFGIKVTTFPRWREYTVHLKRRNDVVHAGASRWTESPPPPRSESCPSCGCGSMMRLSARWHRRAMPGRSDPTACSSHSAGPKAPASDRRFA